MQHCVIQSALADALLAGEARAELLLDRCSRVLGRPWRWLKPLVTRYLKRFGPRARPRHREVIQFLRQDAGFRRARLKYSSELFIAELVVVPPVPAALKWDAPVIESTGDLAKWLGLTPGELRWFADLRALGYKQDEQRLRHYRYRVLSKRFGSVRLIEAPKPRLKDLQRQILIWILEKVPSHPAVHGFVKGRSIQTFVAPHVGQAVVLRIDVRDFFPTFGGVRVQNLFRSLGYSEAVADLLGGICTNSTPSQVWNEIASDTRPTALSELRRMYWRPHLPQGPPSSPMLANMSFYRVDCRLTALAKSAAAVYTRYADDLAFSGGQEFGRGVERFAVHVAAVLLEEGFRVNHRKTRIMRQGVRQHMAGLVTNQRMNIARRDFDRLKALLTNCARFGPESQNREGRPGFRAHLHGRISFVEAINPVKGKRLRTIFETIRWTD